MDNQKKTILSGIQPTGIFTLGNYLGAIRNWVNIQDEYNCLYFMADLHAITVRQEAVQLRKKTLECYALLLACGLDPDKNTIFIQSHVSAHAELAWVLGCYTQFGELSRMTQFKDKSAKNADNINAGLFTYPSLQAADILLYQADFVPVGADQKQHLELSRDIASRFNNIHGDTFKVPEPYITKIGSKIMSLTEPAKKMSKSDENVNAFISILDLPEVIVKKFKRAVTDSENEIVFREGKDGINNLMTIYSIAAGVDFETIQKEFDGKGYGGFKLAVGEAVAEQLRSVRENFERLLKEKDYLEACYKKGAEKAAFLSARTLEKVYRKVGFISS